MHKLKYIIVKTIVRHNILFSYVYFEGIRKVHTFLNPIIKSISRNSTKFDMLRIYDNKKDIVKNELQAIPNRINLTSDLWSSKWCC